MHAIDEHSLLKCPKEVFSPFQVKLATMDKGAQKKMAAALAPADKTTTAITAIPAAAAPRHQNSAISKKIDKAAAKAANPAPSPNIKAEEESSSSTSSSKPTQSERRKKFNQIKYEAKQERRKKEAKAKIAAASAAATSPAIDAGATGDVKEKDNEEGKKKPSFPKHSKHLKPKKDLHLDAEAGNPKQRIVTNEPEPYHCFRCNTDFNKRFSYSWNTSEGVKIICNGCYGLLHVWANPKPIKVVEDANNDIDGDGNSDSDGDSNSNSNSNSDINASGKVRPSVLEERQRADKQSRLENIMKGDQKKVKSTDMDVTRMHQNDGDIKKEKKEKKRWRDDETTSDGGRDEKKKKKLKSEKK